MYKTFIVLLILVCSVIFPAACNKPASPAVEFPVRVGHSIAEVLDTLGKPAKIEPLPTEIWFGPKPVDMSKENYTRKVNHEMENTPKEVWSYPGLKIYFNYNNRVIKVEQKGN